MTQYTSEQLIVAARKYMAEEAAVMSQRPQGMPRAAWRMENAVRMPSFTATDTADERRPQVRLTWAGNGNPYDLWVWDMSRPDCLIEHIDLQSENADERLARYAVA